MNILFPTQVKDVQERRLEDRAVEGRAEAARAATEGRMKALERRLASERDKWAAVSRLDVDDVVDLQRDNARLSGALKQMTERFANLSREQTTAREASSALTAL